MDISPSWRIYYDDGYTFDSTKGEPSDAPAYGLIAIICYNEAIPPERLIVRRWAYYYCKDSIWYGCDFIGLIDQLTAFPKEVHSVKVGRMVNDTIYAELNKKIVNDPDFPITGGKSNRSNGEVTY